MNLSKIINLQKRKIEDKRRLFLGTRMKILKGGYQALTTAMSVTIRSTDVLVAEHFLDQSQIGPIF